MIPRHREIVKDVTRLAELHTTFYGRDFAFDVETTGVNWVRDELLGLALSFGDDSYYIVLRHTIENPDGTLTDTKFIPKIMLRHAMLGVFAQTDVKMVAHNSKFDMHFLLRELGTHVQGQLTDTLLMAKLLNENRDNGLKSLSATVLKDEYTAYQDLPTYKGFKKTEFLGTPLDLGADYAMHDTESTLKLEEIFARQLAQEGLQEAYYMMWQPMIFVLFEMETAGIGLNMPFVRKLLAHYEQVEEESRREVRRAGIEMLLSTYSDLADIPHLYWEMYRGSETAIETDEYGPHVFDDDGVRLPLWRPTERSQFRVLSFNPGSTQQLSDLVFTQTHVKLPPLVKLKAGKTGVTAIDKDNLETILFYAGDNRPRVIEEILKWKKASKFISTYLKRFVKDGDVANFYSIYTSFNQDGTDTGRLSSSGPNLQNIPSRGDIGSEARQCFIARPDKVLVVADYSMMELRVLAHYSKDPQLIAAFEEGKDLHILTGAAFAQMEYEELFQLYKSGDPKGKELRQLGKTGNFALMYGMGAAKFQRYLLVNNKYEITKEQAQEWINAFNLMYLGATQWKIGKPTHRKVGGSWVALPADYEDDGIDRWDIRRKGGVHNWVREHGYVGTIAKRKRRLPDGFSPEKWIRERAQRQGVNAIIQGSCGDIICSAMIGLQAALKGIGGTLLLQVHDELVAEVPAEHGEQAKRLMEAFMNHYGYVNQLSLPLVAEASIGLSWAEAKG